MRIRLAPGGKLAPLFLLPLVTSCGAEESEPEGPGPAHCATYELARPDGSCVRPGVPLDGCAEGFVHDGGNGCIPILPSESCPPGLMAVPGEEICRPVMGCGQGRWGDLPVDGTTQHVDGTFTGGDADGSEGKPWPTIEQAVAAADPGGLIAVAAGTYSEQLIIEDKPVRLWGRCPEQVTIEAVGPGGPDCPLAAVCIMSGADGTEVGGLALRGAGRGLALSGAEDVVVDRVWIHDNAQYGIDVEDALGPTSIEVRGALVEQNVDIGLLVIAAEATVDATVVRTTQPSSSDQRGGRGISVQLACLNTSTGQQCDPLAPGSARVTQTLIEQNHDFGLLVAGSDVTVDGSVVRRTYPRASDQTGGFGISIQPGCAMTPTGWQCDPAARSNATITRSFVEECHDSGMRVVGSDATVDASVVRTTLPRAVDQLNGRGISIEIACTDGGTGLLCDPAARANATVSRSLFDSSYQFGAVVAGSHAVMDLSVVRATLPQVSEARFGDGFAVVGEATTTTAALSNLLIVDSARAGLGSFGSQVSLANSEIRCAAVPLNGEAIDATPFELVDGGGNSCGCPTASGPCKVLSAGLEPPAPLPVSE